MPFEKHIKWLNGGHFLLPYIIIEEQKSTQMKRENPLATIVKCPTCGEVNIGSRLLCAKCQTSLIGVPREQGDSPLGVRLIPPPIPAASKVNQADDGFEKIGVFPLILSSFSFMPLLGVPLGIISVIWGLLSRKKGSKWLILVGGLGITFTFVLYGGLYYFGFVQRGGIYDSLRAQLAQQQLTSLVREIEFYKLQNGQYPPDLHVLAEASSPVHPVFIIDQSTLIFSAPLREYFYEVIEDGSGYYLLSVGADQTPYTSDDLLPAVEPMNIGFKVNPDSNP